MNNECKECKYFGENFYSDDRGYNDNDRINACILTSEGYCEMSYKECHTITDCHYKQLLSEQAKNKKLVEVIEKIRDYELQSLDIDWDEYEAQCRETDYSPIITYCEEGLGVFNGV